MDVHNGNQNQDNEDQNPRKDLGNVNDPKNLILSYDANMQKTKISSSMKIQRLILISVKNRQPHDYVSHGGTLYWTPIVSDDIKPKVKSKFDSYVEVVTMYRNYALESGFEVRLGREKKTKYNIITNRHLGGPSVQGGLVSDFKNARRNLNCYIDGRDVKFLVDKMNDRKKNVPTFTFEYKVLSKRLNALFWADETTKYNYNSSEKLYDMVFVPFTDIDNHKKCVTFGAGLLSQDDGVSYEWLLKAFLKAFRKQPKLVISKQDPALKKAIDNVFPLAHHRLCIWHITKKLPNKILLIEDAATNQNFQKRFHSIIWNSKLEPHDFENVWHMMLEEFKITDNNWMKTMYDRRFWIPAFFKHIPMSGLMRATSLSESQNWSFQTTTLTGSYLIMFMMTFDSVMERQRHNQILNDFNTATTFSKFITCSPNEPHASKIFRRQGVFRTTTTIGNSADTACRREPPPITTARGGSGWCPT
ncbi:protein FAR1-RELATED SEQUENCE 5-like [Lactuca sativa]|uniref:protein FAR1-RELATED SEQUENCE 5-like n=1 Tax=Lactuca sativa TaxID=4236 RepID=UPI000CD88F1A|nr:protein FAR1-RELATED SEQUENCE 5-like [Lactuca sativa]